MISLMITVGVANLLAAMSPGPDFAIVAHNALISRRAGIATAIGISTALLIHSSYCMLGLTIITQQSSILLSLLKTIGGTYIAYMGIRVIISTTNNSVDQNHNKNEKKIRTAEAFSSGFFTCILNPKAMLFIVSLFSMVHSYQLKLYQNLIIALEIPIIGLTWFALLSYIITHPKIYHRYQKHLKKISLSFGLILLAIGISLILK